MGDIGVADRPAGRCISQLELVLAGEAVELPRHQRGEPGILKLPGHDRRADEEPALRGVPQRLRGGGGRRRLA